MELVVAELIVSCNLQIDWIRADMLGKRAMKERIEICHISCLR